MIKNVEFTSVKLLDGFWKKRFDLNAETSIYAVQRVFEESGRFDAVRFKKSDKPLHVYYDSDVAKWIEAVAYLYAHDDKKFAPLKDFCDELIARMVENQREDGYFNSYFLQAAPNECFTDRNLHELYCAGHIVEAAIAYDKYVGNPALLTLAEKMVACIRRVFFEEKSAPYVTDGHEEIELALFALYEYTKKEEYKELGEFFINQRGNNEADKNAPILTLLNAQDNLPARELSSADGHAVRATYYYSGMADMARLCEDDHLKSACLRLFNDITKRKMFVTGGIGSSRVGEAFTLPYDLPNLTAYSESCAAIGLIFFCLRMQKIDTRSAYADVIERVLYNGFLSSTSLDGKSFFYENPLEVCRKESGKEVSAPENRRLVLPIWRRKEVFFCSCCPPNINRFVARIEGVIFAESKEGVYVNQFIPAEMGKGVLRIDTKYPDASTVTVSSNDYPYNKVYIRVPAWCKEYKFVLDGKVGGFSMENGYAVFEVRKSFSIKMQMEMPPSFVYANPKIRDNAGKVCLTRGPVVYCLEEADNGGNLFSLFANTKKSNFQSEFFEKYGLPVLYCDGVRVIEGKENELYASEPTLKETRLKFIPYYAFANREECDMLVWVGETKGY